MITRPRSRSAATPWAWFFWSTITWRLLSSLTASLVLPKAPFRPNNRSLQIRHNDFARTNNCRPMSQPMSLSPPLTLLKGGATDQVFAKADVVDAPIQPISTSSISSSSPTLPPSWDERFEELVGFQAIYNHTFVSKRLPPHRELGLWVNRQRQRYKNMASVLESIQQRPPESSSSAGAGHGGSVKALTEEDVPSLLEQKCSPLDLDRIRRLNAIGFSWDASNAKKEKEREQWWNRLEEIRTACHDNEFEDLCGSSSRPSSTTTATGLSLTNTTLTASQQDWLRRQRNQYVDYYQLGYTNSCSLDEEQIRALNDMDPTWWMTARQRQWEIRFEELQAYKAEHGRYYPEGARILPFR